MLYSHKFNDDIKIANNHTLDVTCQFNNIAKISYNFHGLEEIYNKFKNHL